MKLHPVRMDPHPVKIEAVRKESDSFSMIAQS
jgi:hypothetical protein